MKLSLADLKQVFLEVIQEKKTFEEADAWASKLIHQEQLGKLECNPNDNITKIFSALTYLAGLDMKEPSGEYFHSIKNVEDEFKNIFDAVE